MGFRRNGLTAQMVGVRAILDGSQQKEFALVTSYVLSLKPKQIIIYSTTRSGWALQQLAKNNKPSTVI